MPPCFLAIEAVDCRSLARELHGRPEEPILLRLADEFDRVAVQQSSPAGYQESDLAYFAKRASQETAAAVKARHPKARLAHLKMAQRYDGLSHALRMHR